jgi:hypothetical protein
MADRRRGKGKGSGRAKGLRSIAAHHRRYPVSIMSISRLSQLGTTA